jgi:hypothetical protein
MRLTPNVVPGPTGYTIAMRSAPAVGRCAAVGLDAAAAHVRWRILAQASNPVAILERHERDDAGSSDHLAAQRR